MYRINYGASTLMVTTLGAVLCVLNTRRQADSPPAPTLQEIQVFKDESPMEVVARNGRLGIVQQGSAESIMVNMVAEVGLHLIRPFGKVLKPHQMRKSDWDAAHAVGSAAYGVYPCFTADQLQEPCSYLDQQGRTQRGNVSDFCHHLFVKNFGYGHNGPPYGPGRDCNSRHDVHVAYALAAGEDVPAEVLEDYTLRKEPDFDIGHWFQRLLDFPALRGKIPVRKLQPLSTILRQAKLPLTVENIPYFIRLMSEFETSEPTLCELDDFLYERGVLKALPPIPHTADTSTAYSPLASRIRQLIGEERQAMQLKRIAADRSAGRMTVREFERDMAYAQHIAENETYRWGNELAKAIDTKQVGLLLDVLADAGYDANHASKKAVQEAFGVKLLGAKASDRRAAVFKLVGFDAAQQAAYEQSLSDRRATKEASREKERAIRAAEGARWRTSDGVITGREYVDKAVAEGFTTISSTRKGRALQYWLTNPDTRHSRNILKKDGTLDYARHVLGLQDTGALV